MIRKVAGNASATEARGVFVRMHDLGSQPGCAGVDDVVGAVVDSLRAEFGLALAGVAFTGSRMRGDETDDSDLDVLAVVRDAIWQRRYYLPANALIDVDLTIGGFEFFSRSLHTGANVGLTTMFADAVVACDDGAESVASLVRVARARIATGRPPMTAEALFVLRHRAWSLSKTAADAMRSDVAAGAYVLDNTVTFLVDAYCAINGLWLSGPKSSYRALPTAAPELWNRLAAVECEREPERRLQRMDVLLEFVLAPVGGPLRYGSCSPLSVTSI